MQYGTPTAPWLLAMTIYDTEIITAHDFAPWLKYDIIVQPSDVCIGLCRKNPGVHKMTLWSRLSGHVWRVPFDCAGVYICVFV